MVRKVGRAKSVEARRRCGTQAEIERTAGPGETRGVAEIEARCPGRPSAETQRNEKRTKETQRGTHEKRSVQFCVHCKTQ